MSDTARDTVTNNGHNILIITCDQYQYPRFSYGQQGFDDALKRILGFVKELGKDNPYAKFFPGLMRLRENAVALRNHTIAASACTPSRATIYTGQYGTRTGVTQTDGLFKNENSSQFPWLKVDTIPTLGHWMREAGYDTHYFGKWHISNPPGHSLEQYGFDSWEESYPEPHGALANNLGLYRDVGFADSASRFIRRRGLALNYNRAVSEADRLAPLAPTPPPDGTYQRPWLAVVSFTNPHDIATYPGVISQALPPVTDASGPGGKPPTSQSPLGPISVPVQGARSLPPLPGSMQLHLNPLNFPQDCATNAPTLHEDLSQKPTCQAEYAYKMGLALASKLGFNVASGAQAKKGGDHTEALEALAVATSLQSSIPFQRAADPDGAALAFIQVYAWLHSVVDPHIQQVLQALEDSGQKQNTVVIFLADHGEYAGAHGMLMEKWHTAYQEALHVPVVIQLNPYAVDGAEKEGARSGAPRLTPSSEPRELDALTSHIDLLPTVLGLAGVHAKSRASIYEKLKGRFKDIAPLPGLDLSPLILGQSDVLLEADGRPRQGVLFITSDEITAPFPRSDDPHDVHSQQEFAIFEKVVQVVARGTPGHAPVPLKPGPVCQPNNVHAVRTDQYKLARTFDPSGAVSQQWELYDLKHDPNEQHNLADLNTTPPVPSANLPAWASASEIAARLADLNALLQSLEKRML